MRNDIALNMDLVTPPMSWESFRTSRPPFSIALDGYVSAGPRFDSAGPHWNANHHEGVDRLSTRATCAQVLMAMRQGLFDTFRDAVSRPRAEVWVNDCDEDICTAFFLLSNSALATATMNPLLNRLVSMEDALDTTAGAYPYPADLPVLQELAWVFEPYRRFRLSGQLERRDRDAFVGVISDVGSRIMRHITGSGDAIPLDLRFDVIRSGDGWSIVREIGAHARTAMFARGIRAFVSTRPREDGHSTYTIGRMSPFVRFDIPQIIEALNMAEGITGPDRWGGANTIGGSPRIAGSRLTTSEVVEVVESVVRQR